MPVDQVNDFSIAKLMAGIAGSVVSLRFVQGSNVERVFMAVGGASLSYYASTPAAHWVGVKDAEGLVGFLIGLFGMAIMAKLYEAIQAMDAATIAANAWASIKRKWGA
jgi:hypothetical protein